MKKFVSSVLCVAIIFAMGTVSAAAETVDLVYQNSISASEASEQLTCFFEENGVEVNNQATFELVNVESATNTRSTAKRGTALCMTTVNGDTVTKDVLLAFKEDENGNSVLDNSFNRQAMQPRSGQTVDYPPLDWDGRYVVHGTAVYNVKYQPNTYIPIYQPTGCYFTYQKYSTVSVSSISVLYICDGVKWNWSSFADTGVEDTWTITASKSNPVVNTMYSTTRQYSSSYGLFTETGFGHGNFLTFQCVANGVHDDYTVVL